MFYGDPPGSLLTAGDHKGYGLSLAVEILGGILSGTGPAGPGKGVFANGTLMICLDPARFLPLADFHAQVAALFEWVKSAPLAAGRDRDPDSGRARGAPRGRAPPRRHPDRGRDVDADPGGGRGPRRHVMTVAAASTSPAV